MLQPREESPSQAFTPPMGELPPYNSFPRLGADVDTQGKRHHARPAQNQPRTLALNAASNHIGARQSRQEALVLFGSLSAISGTFNSLFKVLFTFPSWYLFAIGLEPIFSFR